MLMLDSRRRTARWWSSHPMKAAALVLMLDKAGARLDGVAGSTTDAAVPFTADASCIGEACYWYGSAASTAAAIARAQASTPTPSDYPAHCELFEPTNNDPATRSWDPMATPTTATSQSTTHGAPPARRPCALVRRPSGYLPNAA